MYDNQFIYAGNRAYIPDFEKEFQGYPSMPTTVVEQPVLCCVVTKAANFYHWMVESLSRFACAREWFLKSECQLLVPVTEAQFVRDSLLLLQIPLDRVFECKTDMQTRYKFREFYFVDNGTTQSEGTPNMWDVYLPRPQNVKMLHKLLLDTLSSLSIVDDSRSSKVIYVRRVNTHIRNVENEERIVNTLRTRYGGSLYIHEAKRSVVKEAKIFHTAKLVIGPHGAGLSNIIFCKKGTAVVEFPLEPFANNVFRYLCQALGMRYCKLRHLTAFYCGTYLASPEALQELNEVLDSVAADANSERGARNEQF